MSTSEQLQANRRAAAEVADMPDDTIIREPAVLGMTSMSRTSLWRQIKAGTFPAPFKLAGNGWHLGAVREVVRKAV